MKKKEGFFHNDESITRDRSDALTCAVNLSSKIRHQKSRNPQIGFMDKLALMEARNELQISHLHCNILGSLRFQAEILTSNLLRLGVFILGVIRVRFIHTARLKYVKCPLECRALSSGKSKLH